MPRARLAVILGSVLLVVACALPCLPFADLSGASLPYQDPTPDMLHKQAADIAAARTNFIISLLVSTILTLTGIGGVSYGIWTRRAKRRNHHGKQGR
jgi:hypothetical protein